MKKASLPRLSLREGGVDEVLYEGVPPHLRMHLARWMFGHLGDEPREVLHDRRGRPIKPNMSELNRKQRINCDNLALLARVEVGIHTSAQTAMRELIHDSAQQDKVLDVIDLHLQMCGAGADKLAWLLSVSGSAWTIAANPTRLERRVADQQRRLYVEATTTNDNATMELSEAWRKVYGRDPDPSDAWDHAIKAVEILLQPIVSPTNDRATLGSMLAALEAKPEKWTLTLVSSSKTVGPVETLTAMLRLIWPNPDRHGSGSGLSRTPTQEEAEQVVGLAVLVVSWLRKNALQLATSLSTGPSASP